MERIIVVEDDVIDQILVRQHLALVAPGSEVEVYSSADAFLEAKLTGWEGDLAFIFDFNVGGISTIPLIRELRSDTNAYAIAPIILMTGMSSRHVSAAAVTSGIDELLFKQDLSIDSLQRALMRAREASRHRLQRAEQVDRLREIGRMLAHDLRSPIYGLLLSAEYIRDKDSLPEDVRGFADKMYHAAFQAMEMINERVETLQYDAIALEGALTDAVTLEDILDELHALHTPSLTRIGGQIIHKHLARIDADQTLVKQILANLIDNSIKAHGAVPLVIEINVKRSKAGSVLTVRDNGVGIAPERACDLFKSSQGVYGNGLPYIAGMMARLGGEISCESDGKSFTRFTLTFPAAKMD